MSLDVIDHNELRWAVWEFRSLGGELRPLGGGLGWDPELLSLDSVFSHNAIIFARLSRDLLGSPERCG